MFGRSDRQRMRRTLEERRLRNFLHRSTVVRGLVVLGLMAGLAGLTLSGGRLEPLDLTVGQISPRTIVARVNFSWLDENATRQEREKKAGLTPNVYRLMLDPVRRDILRTQHLLERITTLKQSGKISEARLQQVADIWNEGADIPLTAGEVQSLLYLPDRKAFLENLSRWSLKLAEGGIVGNDQFSNPETPLAYGASPDDFSKLHTSRAAQFQTVGQAKQQLMDRLAAARTLSKAAIPTVEKILTDLVAPNLQLDLALSSRLQERQRRSIEPIVRSITKGNVLLERGERMTDERLLMLKAHEQEVQREFSIQGRWRQRLGTGVMAVFIVGSALLVLARRSERGETLTNLEYGAMAAIVLTHVVLCRLTLYVSDTYTTLSPSLIASVLPSCFGPMLCAMLIHRRQAHAAAYVCSFLLGVITQFNFAVMLTSLISALVGIHFLRPLRRRSRIYEAGLLAGVGAGMVNMVFGFMWEVPWSVIGLQAVAALGTAFAASLLISALLPLFESVFKATTDLRWLELSDLNHPLLRRMVMEAPGTYHHSLVVANLAEHACEAIGAHALQARVCAYFHDIGKLNNPGYFCENQVEGHNPHDDMAPNMSALVIIAHVKDGVDMAIQHRMVRPIVDTIQQHHGTSQAAYFYRLAKRHEEDARLGSRIMNLNESDVPRVGEETYRYPGPKPVTREIGVISLADAVESASRSLQRPTPQKIDAMIHDLIEARLLDGQLDECPLSLHDLKEVAESFSKTMLSMMHSRVSYSKEAKDEADVDQPAPFPSAAAS